MKSLSELLKEVDSLFVHKSRAVRLSSYDYTLCRFPYGWSFSVTNSWYKWSAAGLKHEFGAWSTPEAAVNEFLQYVKDNHIKVESLMDKSAEQSVERTQSKFRKPQTNQAINQRVSNPRTCAACNLRRWLCDVCSSFQFALLHSAH